jgi:phage anti-repressor protein
MSEQLSFKDYIKTFTTVNNKFVDDFFSLQDETTTESDFVINFDIIAEWLNSRKDSLKRTLLETYRKNIDYKISENKMTTAGRPSEKIMLTPDCFKRICMLTKSPKGEEVRTYYIQIEKHLDKYKDNIINDLRNRVKVLERNIAPIEVPKDEGVVYVLKTDVNTSLQDVYKIGSTNDFKSRLTTHHSSHADNVEVCYVYKTNDVKGVERCLKAVLKEKQYRKRKEFYQIDIEILKKLITNCSDSLLLIKRTKPKKIKKTITDKSGGGKDKYTTDIDGNYYIYLHKVPSSTN